MNCRRRLRAVLIVVAGWITLSVHPAMADAVSLAQPQTESRKTFSSSPDSEDGLLRVHRRLDYHCHNRRGYRRWCHQGARNWRQGSRYNWRRGSRYYGRPYSRYPRNTWRRRTWPREYQRRRYNRDRPYWRRQPYRTGPSIYWAI